MYVWCIRVVECMYDVQGLLNVCMVFKGCYFHFRSEAVICADVRCY